MNINICALIKTRVLFHHLWVYVKVTSKLYSTYIHESKPYFSPPPLMCSLEQLSYVCYTKINQNVIKIVNHLRACEGRMCSLSYVCLGWDNSAAQSGDRCFSHSQNLMLWKNIFKIFCSEKKHSQSSMLWKKKKKKYLLYLWWILISPHTKVLAQHSENSTLKRGGG